MSLKVLPLGIIGTVLAVAGLIAYSLSPDLLWAVTIAEGLALLCLVLFFILHFDADVVSSTHFSATNYGTPDGLTAEEAGAALEVFCAREELAAFVVTEYIADKDADGSGARKLIDLIVAALRTRVAAPASGESPVVEKAEPDVAPAEAASNS